MGSDTELGRAPGGEHAWPNCVRRSQLSRDYRVLRRSSGTSGRPLLPCSRPSSPLKADDKTLTRNSHCGGTANAGTRHLHEKCGS
jgi:hypothetical protein